MESLPVFHPSAEPTAYQSVAYVRQNAWQKTRNFLDLVLQTKKIHAPHGHQKKDVTLWDTEKSITSQYAMTLHSLENGNVVLIPNGNHGLLVRIKSSTKAGMILGAVIVLRETATLGAESYTDEDVVAIVSSNDTETIAKFIEKGKKITAMYSLYRDIEVVGRVNYNGVNGLALAGMNSSGLRKQYWARV